MSAPTQPTPTTLVTSALTRFLNGGTPDDVEILRAVEYGLEKVKRDIMGMGKTWRPLLKTVYDITKVGVSHYDNPADFESDLTVSLMTGTHSGVMANVGSSTTVTLAPTEDALQAEAEGKYLLITSGNGVDQAQVIDDYTPATQIAITAAAFTNLPNATDGYLIVNSIKNLAKMSVDRYDQYQYPGVPGYPQRFANIPNDTVGQIALHPVPNGVYGLKRRYYVDLMKLDTTSTLYNTILRRWAYVLEQGVYVWKLNEDDDRYATQNAIYQQMLVNIMAHDLAGFDPANIVKEEE
jgi:hypothetical protein